ncbi:MAG: metallopeptidase family protein [Methylobacteriaceae bacterium]|nr:metallopeptidase family protein [Methylobacteriaceae bacterium]
MTGAPEDEAVTAPDNTNWNLAQAPSAEDILQVMQLAWETLPDEFRALCPDVTLDIDEFPDDELVEALEYESAFELLGFFFGDDFRRSPMVLDSPVAANTFRLFRRPVLDYWAETERTLWEVITHVLVSEVGHYYGLSDHELATIEVNAGGCQTEIIH